jgi:aminodeoxyfutalosine deaminase
MPAPPQSADSPFTWIEPVPKAELHIHLEGTLEPPTVVALAARHGAAIEPAAVISRYATRDFAAFLDAYKWVTSYLRDPEDYALAVRHMAEQLLAQGVVYAEVTLSVGVMLLRRQDVVANFRAIREAAASFEPRGLRLQWIFDAVRQFGAAAAMEVARHAARLRRQGVVAFGMGGDELALPAAEFRAVYDFAAASGLHRLVHAGEVGGPASVRDAVELLGAERIGHGIAASGDHRLLLLLAERSIPLEICPTSNLRTGALARLIGNSSASLADHPLPRLHRLGVPLSVSTDDPAMFETRLNREYAALGGMGLSAAEIVRIAEAGFTGAFLPPVEKDELLIRFHRRAAELGLL